MVMVLVATALRYSAEDSEEVRDVRGTSCTRITKPIPVLGSGTL
jgi:hypothetical protein